MNLEEANKLSGKTLKKKVRYWQGQLSLMDWEVKTLLVSEADLNGKAGTVSWDMETKQAIINLVDPKTITTELDFPYDLEKVIVHELLHLHSAPFDTFKEGSNKYTALEVMINKVADSLVNLARCSE